MFPVNQSQPSQIEAQPKCWLPVLPIEMITYYIQNDFEILLPKIEKENSYPAITIYHFIVGSHTMEDNINHPNPKLRRNHEFPQVVKNILYNPELQFSPEMQAYISHYETFNIIQKLFLIDPMYATNQDPIGLLKEIALWGEVIQDGKITHECELQHNEFKKTKIQSSLEPVVIPNDIDEKQLLSLIKMITGYANQYQVLINLIDCSSHTLRNLYVHNQNPYVYIATPNCLLQDNTIPYMPVITIQEDKQQCRQQGSQQDTQDIQTITIRWCNYELDRCHIPDYQTVKDICRNAEITYSFLINIYKNKKMEIDLLTIYKFLGLLSVTKEYQLSNGKSFAFNMLTFPDFLELWQLREFQNIFLVSFDPYFKENITMYINTLTSNHRPNLLDININIRNVLFLEAWNILKQLKEYFPDDEKIPFPEHYSQVDRFKIKDYLEGNGVHQ